MKINLVISFLMLIVFRVALALRLNLAAQAPSQVMCLLKWTSPTEKPCNAFQVAAGGLIEGSSVDGGNGFYDSRFSWQWQFGLNDSEMEIFADMFLGWVYGKWEPGKLPSGLSINGQYKSDYMNKYMPLMINKVVGR